MDRLLSWAIDNDALMYALILGSVSVALFTIALTIGFAQGREISIIPPRIGERPNITDSTRGGIEDAEYANKVPSVRNILDSTASHPQVESFMRAGYPRSQHPEFFSEVERLLPNAKRITLVAMGLNLLWQKNILDCLLHRAETENINVTICLGNPFNPHVEDRLIEEEMRDSRPPVGRSGIIKNSLSLLDKIEEMQFNRNFKFLFFEHYLTIATLAFDDDIFLYPYAYQEFGNLSPVFHIHNDGSEVPKFFMENLERIVSDVVPANEIIRNRRSPGLVSSSWLEAAVFIIPDIDDPFYKFGTMILGYDIWNERSIARERFSDFGDFVGGAKDFGFHSTIVDALYFASESVLDRVSAELRHISEIFRPFWVSNLSVVAGLDKRGDVVISCTDPSGTMEALHHELVSRVYNLSISSRHLASRSRTELQSETARDQMMMMRYGAPFIIGEYRPHFTLLSSPPKEKGAVSNIVRELQNFLLESGCEKIHIDKLALVTRGRSTDSWRIQKIFELKSAE